MNIQKILGQIGHSTDEKFLEEISTETNKNYHNLYLSSVLSSVIKCHEFIDNQINLAETLKEEQKSTPVPNG